VDTVNNLKKYIGEMAIDAVERDREKIIEAKPPGEEIVAALSPTTYQNPPTNSIADAGKAR
jgi:hypothetical protein